MTVSSRRAMCPNICGVECVTTEFWVGGKLRWESPDMVLDSSWPSPDVAKGSYRAKLLRLISEEDMAKVHGQAHETVLHGGMMIDKWQQKPFYYVYYNNINKGAVSFTILPIFSSDINSREACKWLVH